VYKCGRPLDDQTGPGVDLQPITFSTSPTSRLRELTGRASCRPPSTSAFVAGVRSRSAALFRSYRLNSNSWDPVWPTVFPLKCMESCDILDRYVGIVMIRRPGLSGTYFVSPFTYRQAPSEHTMSSKSSVAPNLSAT